VKQLKNEQNVGCSAMMYTTSKMPCDYFCIGYSPGIKKKKNKKKERKKERKKEKKVLLLWWQH